METVYNTKISICNYFVNENLLVKLHFCKMLFYYKNKNDNKTNDI